MNTQQLLKLIFASILGGVIVLGGYKLVMEEKPTTIIQPVKDNVKFSNFNPNSSSTAVISEKLSFVTAAKLTTPAVVHIRTIYKSSDYRTGSGDSGSRLRSFKDFFKDSFEDNPNYGRAKMGTSSGVIISKDGYIVTNNHVIGNADEIEVLLNDNSTYQGKIVGTDPTTDLALIKIDAENLPAVIMGNSDEIEVGEWVLAVGNPFDFRATVTAGIVSAKGRNINILQNRNGLQIESFIQTDAAVNPGNSGGALVNLKGELVGINTAIATPTGSYAGYSFAVPSLLVNKVVLDLKEYGVVQRALLGINIRDVTAKLSKEENLSVLEGVYVERVNNKSAADEAGIETGDVIIAINDETVKKTSKLQEKVALNRPGDKVKVTLLRKGKKKEIYVILKNTFGTTEIVASNNNFTIEGATFENVSERDIEQLNLKEGGAKLVNLEKGKWKESGIKEGFIITSIDRESVTNVEDLASALARSTVANSNNSFNDSSNGSGKLIEGIYPNGSRAYYGIGW